MQSWRRRNPISRTPKTKLSAELVVEARSDGRDGRQNLMLRETSRFTGRYEGYLKLTDENGGDDADGWGLDADRSDKPVKSEALRLSALRADLW